MLNSKTMAAALLVAMMASSGSALAYQGFSRDMLHVRAGPGVNYPVLVTLDSNVPVYVAGCTEGWRWCEVETGGVHGWAYASDIDVLYDNRHVDIIDTGPRVGVPVVVFEQRSYWDKYYHDRNFYHNRAYWRDLHTHGGRYNDHSSRPHYNR